MIQDSFSQNLLATYLHCCDFICGLIVIFWEAIAGFNDVTLVLPIDGCMWEVKPMRPFLTVNSSLILLAFGHLKWISG